MKITQKILEKIIKEEIAKVLAEKPNTGRGPTIQRGAPPGSDTQSDFVYADDGHGDSSSSEDFRPPSVKRKEKEEKIKALEAQIKAEKDRAKKKKLEAKLRRLRSTGK